ncbi:MAG: hypothetical protein JWM74_5796 [Myxococcaceae bacterium]|nr:hypothetical protein [Myxococcaceae bacterium]
MSASSYRFVVRDVFRFGDDSTVFVGDVDTKLTWLTPAAAEVQVNGKTIAQLHLSEERMPGPNAEGQRAVVTRQAIDIDAVRAGACVLICQMVV